MTKVHEVAGTGSVLRTSAGWLVLDAKGSAMTSFKLAKDETEQDARAWLEAWAKLG